MNALLPLVVMFGALATGSARAEAPSWTFEVVEIVDATDGGHVLHLVPAPRGEELPRSCEVFVVHARYDDGQWEPSMRRYVSRESHRKSLRRLRQAQASNFLIRFGAGGQGFGAIAGASSCEVSSRGLSTLKDDDGGFTTWSFHRQIGAGR